MILRLWSFYINYHDKRRRVESTDFLMFRPLFRGYERKIFGIGAENADINIYGLTGPQGL